MVVNEQVLSTMPLGVPPSDWDAVYLEDVTSKIGSGETPRGGEKGYQSHGMPFIRSQNVYDHEFRIDGLAHIGPEAAEKLRRVAVKRNDVLLNITGEAIARCCVVPPWILPARVNQHVAIVRPDPEQLDSVFLQKYLCHPKVKAYMLGHDAGGTRKALTKGHIERFLIALPPLEEQRAIATILGSIDNKIELNRLMSATLEGMARAIFRSWFVDFDPVRAKIEGRQSTVMDGEAAALFPDSFEDSPLAEIPKGWRIGTLGDIAEDHRRGVDPTEVAPSTPYIGLEHMPRKNIALSEWGEAGDVGSNKFEFRQGEILFGKLRPYFHKVVVAPVDGVCSTDIIVVLPRDPMWYGLVLSHLSSVDLINYADATSTGTKMPRTKWSDLSRFPIVLPPEQIAESFTDKVGPLVEAIRVNILQSRTLAAVRDALLPKLISGEVRVGEVVEQVEEAL